MKIILVGYMGSGKSIVASKLAEILHIENLDLDNCIEKSQNQSIKDIFLQKGELFFRKLEHQVFNEILAEPDDVIISTGGGTPCYYNNHEVLNAPNCTSIFLKATVDTLFDRLQFEKQKRPLIANLTDDDAKTFIAKHLFERNFYYNKAAYTVYVDGKTVTEIVAEIKLLLT
jgi:shikimate kinase